MNVRRALTYLFADPRWPGKLGIAMLLNLLPTALIAYRQLVMDNGDPQSADPLGNLLWTGATTFAMIPVYGYLLRIVRNVVAGADLLLPEWTDVQRLLHVGLSLWCIVVLWGLPSTLLRAIGNPTIFGDDLGRAMVVAATVGPYLQFVLYHLYGQVYARTMR
jgi:hypothetical protein